MLAAPRYSNRYYGCLANPPRHCRQSSLATVSATPLPISIINLDRDTVRLSNTIKQLTSKGVPLETIERQPAVHGASLSKADLRSNTTRLGRLFASKGMIGCYLSHKVFGSVRSRPIAIGRSCSRMTLSWRTPLPTACRPRLASSRRAPRRVAHGTCFIGCARLRQSKRTPRLEPHQRLCERRRA